MFQEVDRTVPDLSVLRRLLFASAHINKEMPLYWEEVVGFAYDGIDKKPRIEEVKVLLENINCLEQRAFHTDAELIAELHTQRSSQNHPLGVVLISSNKICRLCGGNLLIRSDRPSTLTLYTENMGTVLATHYRKYCQNYRKGCTFTQHYSYHSNSDDEVIYDVNWDDLPYFLSSNQTAFSTTFLSKFEAEILLGQMSYNQKSNIYNYYNKYETTAKQSRYLVGMKTRGAEDKEKR